MKKNLSFELGEDLKPSISKENRARKQISSIRGFYCNCDRAFIQQGKKCPICGLPPERDYKKRRN